MILKKEIVVWMLVGSTFAVNGQSITPEVIASAGEHFSNGSAQLSWTLGEMMIDTYSNGSNILTQGFHQTQLTVTGISENNQLNLDVNVFPNPTAEMLNITIDGKHGELTTTLYDMRGKVVLSKVMGSNQTHSQFSVQSLAMGQYVLKVSEEGAYSSSYRIIRSAK